MTTVRGGCHCGNVAYEITVEAAGALAVRGCGCDFCTKHGAAWWSRPGARLSVRISEPDRLQAYAFGTETAEFRICGCCGVLAFVTCTIEGRDHAVVNARTFENVELLGARTEAGDLSGETRQERLDRRKRTWLSDVEIITG